MVGRIHRLGQSQQVLIKKFALRNSINENIVVLHERIKTGQTWGQIAKIANGTHLASSAFLASADGAFDQGR